MIQRFSKYLYVLLLLTASVTTFGQGSILAEGSWVKIPVTENSIIRLSFTDLQNGGLPVSGIDPDMIRVYGTGGGMLPQQNDSTVFIDPQEIAITVVSNNADVFSSGDYILFYAEGPDFIRFNRDTETVDYQGHLFTDQNFYFITVDQQEGKRINSSPAIAPGPALSTGIQYVIHEEELHNELGSGRNWFGEKFDLVTNQGFDAQLDNLSPSGEVKIFSSVMAASTAITSFDVSINNALVGNQELSTIPGFNYTRKGTTRQDWFVTTSADIGTEINTVNYLFKKTSGLGYLDYFILQAETELIYANKPLQFFTGNYAESENRTLKVQNYPAGARCWDITNPLTPKQLFVDASGGVASINISHDAENIIIFDDSENSNAVSLETVEPQNLKAVTQAELLIVSNHEYMSVAEQIAEIRRNEGISTQAASDLEIYHEFSSGKKDITAIRNYIRYLYHNAGLKYVLLLGKGTFDPKDILNSGKEKLPIYQSRNSLFPLATYSSDDYLTFMEEHEGYWAEDGTNDHTADIGIGRIPITTINEAEIYLAKLKAYKSKSALGNWRQKVVFVAENGDYNIHQRDAERLATLIDTTYEAFTTRKIYVDDYPIVLRPGSRRAPAANKDIYEVINSGALIVNYTGHGNEIQWANTRVFDTRVIDSLRNNVTLPLFVTATCEFGRHDDTGSKSGAEDLLLQGPTGAIAAITTSRPVFSSSNYDLNKAFYNSVFEKQDGVFQKLGDIFKYTKNNSINGVQNRNFILLGDPSMTLSYPKETVVLDSLNGLPITQDDTLKALEYLSFTGSIRQGNGTIESSFNGQTKIQILDKNRITQTIGQANGSEPDPNYQPVPFNYKVRDNVLFSGSATITNGQFNFTTILPKDITYNPESARIVLYASRNDSTTDAAGANIDFLVGSSSNNSLIDNIPPEINVFIGDTTFNNGDVVNSSSLLVIRLADEYGINTSKSQIGHSITYRLDDQDPVSLNQYYNTETDDFTKGWVYYNLPKLSPGKHRLAVTAWDTSNNSNTREVEFTVLGENQIIIANLSNYPNPMRERTNFTFSHNLGGEDLEVTLEIISTDGQRIYSETRQYYEAPGTIDDWQWNGRNSSGGKLTGGIYIYGIFLRSNSSGIAQNQYSRLFIAN